MTYEAAFSQIDITPDFQTELIGAYRADNHAEGVLHRLYAQVLLLKRQQDIYCLVAIDNLGLTIALGDTLRDQIAVQLNTVRTNVMLNFSHTHSAPCPAPIAQNGTRYFNLMTTRIIEAVISAGNKLKPCKAGWALTEAVVGENRREGCRIMDNRLGALRIADAKTAEPLVTVLRLSTHANVLMTGSNAVSSDYFGVARDVLAPYFEGPVMLLQGAAGNIKPIGVDKVYGGSPADIIPIVERLKTAVMQLRFDLHDIRDIMMASKEIICSCDVPTKEAAAKIAAEAGIPAESWLLECERLRAEGITVQNQTREIQFLKINDGCICGVADELFCEPALEAARLTGNRLLFLNGYTNGCNGYLPTKPEWHKGGYETLYSYLNTYLFHGHVMPFQDDTAERIVALVVKTWNEMQLTRPLG